jgi:hypothetical protein
MLARKAPSFRGRPMLILQAPGGEPMELNWFLRLAVSLAAALGKLHLGTKFESLFVLDSRSLCLQI